MIPAPGMRASDSTCERSVSWSVYLCLSVNRSFVVALSPPHPSSRAVHPSVRPNVSCPHMMFTTSKLSANSSKNPSLHFRVVERVVHRCVCQCMFKKRGGGSVCDASTMRLHWLFLLFLLLLLLLLPPSRALAWLLNLNCRLNLIFRF